MNHTQKIKESVKRLFDTREERLSTYKRCKEIEEKEAKEISNYMFCNKDKDGKPLKTIDVLVDGGTGKEGDELALKPQLFRVTKSRSRKIVFTVEGLKKVLSKEFQKKVIRKRYEITNFDGLKEYLKSCGVDPKVFKKFICVTESVDEEKMEHLYALGYINIKDLKGSYELKESKESITVKKLK